jgi:hypothetical protein
MLSIRIHEHAVRVQGIVVIGVLSQVEPEVPSFGELLVG